MNELLSVMISNSTEKQHSLW